MAKQITLNNLQDLQKYLGTSQGIQTVFSIRDVSSALKQAASLLEQFLKDEIESYLDSYNPTVYKRTGHWLSSIRVREPKRVGNNLEIEIYFEDSLAYHDSLFGGEDGYVPWLYEVGWHWDSSKSHRVYRLSDFEGIGYVKNAVEKFNSVNRWGFKIHVYHDNEKYI